MHSKKDYTTRLLLSFTQKGNAGNLLKFLPEEARDRLEAISLSTTDAHKLFPSEEKALQSIHWSWLAPVLEQAPTGLRQLYLAALPKSKASPLSEWLKIPLPSFPVSRSARQYLLHDLRRKTANPKVLPRPFLPGGPYDDLLHKSKQELILIVDLLGLHDLAQEMRHIVDQKAIKRVLDVLSTKKQAYLKICLSLPDPFRTPKIGLATWNGLPKTLESRIHKRGLARLGRALAGQDPSFLWHVVRMLDTGRGKVLRKYLSPKEIPGVTPVLGGQLANIMRFLEK